MATGNLIIYYAKSMLVNSWLSKTIVAALFAVVAEMTCCDRLVSIQFILVGWMITTLVGVVGGSIKDGFKFRKLILGCARLFMYFTTLSLFMMADKAFNTGFLFKFAYGYIIIDMIKIFFKHSPYIGININSGMIEFVKKVESRIQEYFLQKIGLTKDLNSNPNKNDGNSTSSKLSNNSNDGVNKTNGNIEEI